MLPFLKKQNEASASMPADKQMRKPDDGAEYDVMHSAAQDLIDAVHAKDVKGVAEALKAAFELADSQPHEEGPHI